MLLLLFLLSNLIKIGQSCEAIREPLCQTGINYNSTVFPNLAGHLFQGGASVGLRNIKSLIEKQCSPNIREFLCRVYMPECSSTGKPVLPSWEMCQESYEGCDTLMSSLGYSWIFSLNCTRFTVSTIDAIKEIAKDSSAFWFGSGVTSLCNKTHTTMACKINPRPGHVDSIVSRFGGNVDISQVDRLTKILYTFSNGSFQACNNDYSLPGGSFQVDPLSPKVHYPWEVRNAPTFTWPSNPGEYFACVLYDVGFHSLHALYVNIPRSDLTLSDAIKKYNGPGNPTTVQNPYVFLIYKQDGHIQLTDSLRRDLTSKPLETLKLNSHFNGPKAMSWLKIKEDPYSIQTSKADNILNNCPTLVSEALKHQNQPFVPSDMMLEMSVDVFYSPSSITFTSCCKTYVYRETSFNVNPIGNPTVPTAHVRTSAVPSITLIKRETYPAATNFSGTELYTLIMVDPDVPSSAGNPTHPLIHWMVLNIPNGNVNDGMTLREYKGPSPSTGSHTYYFLLYKQTTTINPSVISNYTSSTCSRCKFDIKRFTQHQGLTLTGASWMVTKLDEYVRHLHIDESSKDVATECSHEPHYSQSCSSGLISQIVG